MPELPEVETIVRVLRAKIPGKRIEKVQVYLKKITRPNPGHFIWIVKGARIQTIERLGKYIILELRRNRSSEPAYVAIHLKMTGQLLYVPKSKDRSEYVHVKISFTGPGELLYRDIRQFGFLHAMGRPEFTAWKEMQGLGPDPFELKPERLAALLKNRKGRVKSLLLNQRFMRGLGNIYVDESLFAAGIHPLTPACSISEERCLILHREMNKILKKAIRLKGSTISNFQVPDGQKGRFQNMHRVYRRHGEPCPVCGNEIIRTVIGGRGTYFCPNCQPASLK